MADVDEARLRTSADAEVWAEEFCKKFSVFTDEGVIEDKVGLMIGWFANAINAGGQEQRDYG